jgi:hypothetical protein
MPDPANAHSLSDFKRRTAQHLRQLKRTGRPRLLTIDGKPELIVQDARSYHEMLERAEAIVGIQRGLDEFAAGKGRPAKAAIRKAIRKRAARR